MMSSHIPTTGKQNRRNITYPASWSWVILTTTPPILPGERAQYRKVGKVEVLACLTDDGLLREYRVRFLTGPRKYKDGEHTVWLSPEDVLW